MKKYKLLKKSKIEFLGKTLFQIQALKDFGYISEGEKGGFVESEVNLSQEGDSWVAGNAMISGRRKGFGRCKGFWRCVGFRQCKGFWQCKGFGRYKD
jgi:hypothetical protein